MAKRFLAAGATIALLCAPSTVRAQTVSGPPRLSLTPAVVSVNVRPGQTVRETITLNNQTAQGLPFSMAAEDVLVRNGKRTFVPAGETAHSIAASAVFSQRSGYVDPSSAKTVQVLLTVPAETNIRGVVVFFRAQHVTAPSGSVTLNASLGSLVTFTITGDIELAAGPVQIRPATASENLQVADVLTNVGREPAVVDGVAAFVGTNGSLVARIPFPSLRYMPGERLKMTAEYSGLLRRGRYRAICTFTYQGKSLTRIASFSVR